MNLSLFERDENDSAKTREAGYSGDLGETVADYVTNRRVHARRILTVNWDNLTKSERGVQQMFNSQRDNETACDSPANQKLLKRLVEDYCM